MDRSQRVKGLLGEAGRNVAMGNAVVGYERGKGWLMEGWKARGWCRSKRE